MPARTCWRCQSGVGRTRSDLCLACHQRLADEGRKWCQRCHQAHPLRRFHRGASCCRRCWAAYQAAYRVTHPRDRDAANAQRRARYATDPAYREARKESARIADRSRARRAR